MYNANPTYSIMHISFKSTWDAPTSELRLLRFEALSQRILPIVYTAFTGA